VTAQLEFSLATAFVWAKTVDDVGEA